MTREFQPGEYELPAGYRLQDYEIVETLGAGGFAITYLAKDVALNTLVALKEYFPDHGVRRLSDGRLEPTSPESARLYAWGFEKYALEARTLARFNHANIVRVLRFFEANGTGYIVQEYIDGTELLAKLAGAGPMTCTEVRGLLNSVLSGLQAVHDQDVQHLDIKPSNIMLRRDGTPVLIDFGAARQALESEAEQASSANRPSSAYVHSKGYSPIEVHQRRSSQGKSVLGPWSDLYALAATAYCALTLETPPDVVERMPDDAYRPLREHYAHLGSPEVLDAIDWAMSFRRQDRPQSVAEWRDALNGIASSTEQPPNERAAAAQTEPVEPTPHVTPTASTSSVFNALATLTIDRRLLVPAGLVAAALGLGIFTLSTMVEPPPAEVPEQTVGERSIQQAAPGGQWTRIDLGSLGLKDGNFALSSAEPFRVKTDEGVLLVTPEAPLDLGALTSDAIEVRPAGSGAIEVTIAY